MKIQSLCWKDLISIEKDDSAFNLKVGNRGLSILESLEGNKINFKKYTITTIRIGDNENDHAERTTSEIILKKITIMITTEEETDSEGIGQELN